MIDQAQKDNVKQVVEEFFSKMTVEISSVDVSSSVGEENRDVIDLDVKLEEPQIVIGQQGQTLFEIQRVLRTILGKRLKQILYLNLDINNYKKQKIEYLKDIVRDLADQVARTGQEKVLSPMSAYERRVVHAELSQRTDVSTESQGNGFERHIVIKPR